MNIEKRIKKLKRMGVVPVPAWKNKLIQMDLEELDALALELSEKTPEGRELSYYSKTVARFANERRKAEKRRAQLSLEIK
jgi:hypothetical protein